MSYQLLDAMERLGNPRILVLGDLILDRYVWCDAERISQEAPVILLQEDRQEYRLGGASNVANMLRGLDAEVTLAGLVGRDADAQVVREELTNAGVDASLVLTDSSRPTTVKTRFMGRAQYRHPHQMLRVDREVRTPIQDEMVDRFLTELLPRLEEFQAILVSDYAKGVCTPELLQPLIHAARKAGIPIVVDPANHGDCTAYRGATAVTPNRLETSRATERTMNSIEEAFIAGKQLCADVELDCAFVTLDRDGIVVAESSGTITHCPTRPREVCDITGAGDMVLAMIGVGMAAGLSPIDLARLANVAGGLEVEQIGCARISRRQILADILHGTRQGGSKVCTLAELQRHVAARRKAGQKIVLTNGCFDLLHVGHLNYLQDAAREGDCLIVAINSDASVRRLEKGDDRPLFDQDYRSRMLAGLEAVDYVIIFDEATPHALLAALQPDLLVKGGTYTEEQIVGREVVHAYGGKVKSLSVIDGLSTTEIVRRIRDSAPSTIRFPAPASTRLPERKAG